MPRKRNSSRYDFNRQAYYVGYLRGSGVDEKLLSSSSNPDYMTTDSESSVSYYKGMIDGRRNSNFKKQKFKKRFRFKKNK